MRDAERRKIEAKAREQQASAKGALQAMWKNLEAKVVADAATQIDAGASTNLARADHLHVLSWGSFRPSGRVVSTTTARIYTSGNSNMPHIGKKPPEPKPPVVLARTKETMPILAHRAAHLRATQKGIRLFSLAHGPLEIESYATCRCYSLFYRPSGVPLAEEPPRHAECPDDAGHCGFYAVPADVEAQHTPTTVDLLVELSGKVVEHEKGYRAQHQRILEVRVAGRCLVCGEPPTRLRFDYVGYDDAYPLCEKDATVPFPEVIMNKEDFYVARYGHAVTFDRLAEVLGVPVVLMPE